MVPAFKVSSILLKVTVSPPVLPGYSFKIRVGLAIIFVSFERMSAFNKLINCWLVNWFELFAEGADGKLSAVGGVVSFIVLNNWPLALTINLLPCLKAQLLSRVVPSDISTSNNLTVSATCLCLKSSCLM